MDRKFWIVMFVTASLLPVLSLAQPPDTLWSQTWDYPGEDENLYCIRPTFDGGLILCGTMDYGPGARNAWVMRTDASGSEIWSQLNSGGISESADYIEQTSDGGFIECGETWSYSPYDDWDGYVRKLDEDGTQQWARLLGADDYQDYQLCVRPLPQGGYVSLGSIGGSSTLTRLGPQGGILWQHPFPPQWASGAHFVEPTANGEFLLTGRVENSMRIARMNANGQLLWSFQYPEQHSGGGECLRELRNGFIVASGYASFGMSYAWYVVLTTPDGGIIWEDSIDTPGGENAESIWETPDGNFIIAGWHGQNSVSEYWLIKYDLSGNRLWHKTIPDGWVRSTCQTRDGGYVIGGDMLPPFEDHSQAFQVFKTEPEVDVALTPQVTIVPTNGGTIPWSGSTSNILLDPTPLTAWARVTHNASGISLPLQQLPVTLQPSGSFTSGTINLTVPAWVPAGEYTYAVHLGHYNQPTNNMGYDEFAFMKEGDVVNEANACGTMNQLAAAQAPDAFTAFFDGMEEPSRKPSDQPASDPLDKDFTLSAFPNPFNAATTISLELPESAEVTVTVYNLQGHTVAVLAHGDRLASGHHSFAFDGSNLASGVYLVRVSIPGCLDQVRKLMLVR